MTYIQPPTRSSSDQVLSADHNTYVRDNFIEVEARKRVDYVEVTSDVTVSATTAATATTIITANAFTPSGSDVYRIEYGISRFNVAANAGGNTVFFHLYENSTNLGQIGSLGVTTNAALESAMYGSREFTPSNASKTYSIRAHRTNANSTAEAGSGGAGLDFPIWMRITRLP